MPRRSWVAAVTAAVVVGVPVAIVTEQLGWSLVAVALTGGLTAGCAGALAAWPLKRRQI